VLTGRRPDSHIKSPKKTRSTKVLTSPQLSDTTGQKPRVTPKEAAATTPSKINGIRLVLAILPAFPPLGFYHQQYPLWIRAVNIKLDP